MAGGRSRVGTLLAVPLLVAPHHSLAPRGVVPFMTAWFNVFVNPRRRSSSLSDRV